MENSSSSNTRELIISSAFSFYTKPVMENISLSSIASRAGITKTAIYRHFKNRQELDDVLLDRVFCDIYAILSKIQPERKENVLSILEDIIILLLTHKEYVFYIISTQVDFGLDKVLLKLKKMGLCLFDSIFVNDGSVTNMEKYKNSIYIGANIIFFEVVRNRSIEEFGIQDSYSDISAYASKIVKFFQTGLNQETESLSFSRMTELDGFCSSNMKSLKPLNKMFVSVSEIIKQKGFQGITVESVAKGIGLAKSSLYTHFENKDQMLCSLIQDEFEELFLLINKNISFAENNVERGYILMETVLLYVMQKNEVLTIAQWLQFHDADELSHDREKNTDWIYKKYFDGIQLFDNYPDLGLPCENKRIILSWFMTVPVILFLHTQNQKISPDVVQAMLKDIIIMMETGVNF